MGRSQIVNVTLHFVMFSFCQNSQLSFGGKCNVDHIYNLQFTSFADIYNNKDMTGYGTKGKDFVWF